MTTLHLDISLNLNYRVQGTGKSLLMFNGASLPLTFWGSLADRLAALFQVIRFDQRNAGSTQFEGEFSLNDVANDAAKLLDHINVDQAVIIGHAWGGRAAQVFARDYPHRVAGLVICGTGGQFPPADTGDWLARMREARKTGARQQWETALEALFCGKNFSKREPEVFQQLADAAWQMPTARGRWNPKISPSKSYWGQSRVPTLLLYGDQDKNGTPENARDLQSRLDAKLVTYEDAGHFVVREKEPEVAEQIKGFVESLTATG